MGLIPESGRCPGEGHGNPLQYSYLENPIAGYSPKGHKEADMTECILTHHCPLSLFSFFLLFLSLFFRGGSMQGLSSTTKDRTQNPCSGNTES